MLRIANTPTQQLPKTKEEKKDSDSDDDDAVQSMPFVSFWNTEKVNTKAKVELSSDEENPGENVDAETLERINAIEASPELKLASEALKGLKNKQNTLNTSNDAAALKQALAEAMEELT